MVSSPRILIGPAGSCINRDYARRGWAAETGHPRRGPRDPSQNFKAGTKANMTARMAHTFWLIHHYTPQHKCSMHVYVCVCVCVCVCVSPAHKSRETWGQ